ncbi:MAG: M48 family peptidase, partial [Betaproteobacteria bacterium]|nr:M48 family peptidase [Betaproteobacteria bacterium]
MKRAKVHRTKSKPSDLPLDHLQQLCAPSPPGRPPQSPAAASPATADASSPPGAAQLQRWEVSLIGSQALNAFAMPGGKIAFYTGIIDRLQLTDDEIAFVMGHEIAHALREHGRERQSKAMIAQGLSIGASILSQVMGYGDIGGQVARGVSNVTMLKFSRDDESEAD